jgi:subtilisin family serine protease
MELSPAGVRTHPPPMTRTGHLREPPGSGVNGPNGRPFTPSMITLLGRTLRRYAILLMLTSLTGSLSVADKPSGAIRPAAITIQAPHHDTPALPAGVSVVPGRFLAKGNLPARLKRSLSASQLSEFQQIGWREFATEVPVAEALEAVRAAGLVGEPVYAGTVAAVADACLEPGCQIDQWHHAATVAPSTWSASPSADQVTVAVLDTRIDRSHPDWIGTGGTGPSLAEGGQLRLDRARDLVSDHGGSAAYHGTFVAGLVAAASNGSDAIGAAPRGVSVLPITVVNGSGNTDVSTLIEGIVWAWRSGAEVINLSLGVLGDSAALRDTLKLVTRGDAYTGPALVVAAAGNNTGSSAFYPGSYPEVMSVAGTSRPDGPAACSNYNSNVSVSAPADRLVGLAPMPQRLLQAPCGTSAATPQVSALAALLFAQDPARTPQQVRSIIERSADDLGAPGRDDHFGHGRINFSRALASSDAGVGHTAIVAPRSGSASIEVPSRAGQGTVNAAEMRLNSISSSPRSASAKDGSFDSRSEAVTASVDAGLLTPGVNRAYIRVRDSKGWGGYASIPVTIDTTAPTISGLTVSNAVRVTDPLRVNFFAADSASHDLVYAMELVGTVTGQRITTQAINTTGGPQSYLWSLPGHLTPGHYRVVLAVADPSGNTSRVEAGTIIA